MDMNMIEAQVETSSRAIVNKRELARIIKCSVKTIDSIIDRYPDLPILRRGNTGTEWAFDPEAVTTFLEVKKAEAAAADRARSKLIDQMTMPGRRGQ